MKIFIKQLLCVHDYKEYWSSFGWLEDKPSIKFNTSNESCDICFKKRTIHKEIRYSYIHWLQTNEITGFIEQGKVTTKIY